MKHTVTIIRKPIIGYIGKVVIKPLKSVFTFNDLDKAMSFKSSIENKYKSNLYVVSLN